MAFLLSKINSSSIDGLIRIFLYLLIFWLPYSPAVIEICVSLSLVLWILKRTMILNQQFPSLSSFKEKVVGILKAFKPAASPLNKAIVFFLLVGLISASHSILWQQSLKNFFTKTVEWFIVYFLMLEVFREKKHFKTAGIIFIVTTFAVALDSFIQFYITSKDIFLQHTIEPGSRATASFKTPNGLGAYLTLAVPLGLSLFFSKKYPWRVCFIFFIACLWSLGLTFSRGAWVGTLSGMAFVLLIKGFFHNEKFIFLISTRGFILMLIFLAGFVFSIHLIENSSWKRLNTAQWRLAIWQDTLKMIKDHPFLGHGPNTFMQLFQSYRRDVGTQPTYAHNCYLQLATENGLLGLGGFLWIIGIVFSNSLKTIHQFFKNNDPFLIAAMGLLGGMLAFLVHSFFDNHLFSLQLSIYLWVVIGLQMALLKLYVKKP